MGLFELEEQFNTLCSDRYDHALSVLPFDLESMSVFFCMKGSCILIGKSMQRYYYVVVKYVWMLGFLRGGPDLV